MRTFKLSLVFTVVLALASSAIVEASPHTASRATQSHSPSPMADLLAVVNAPRGTFNKNRLTFEHVRSNVTWFTDRPYRDAGFFGVGNLVQLFFTRQSPPNAALEFVGAGGSHHVAIVEVSAPHYEAKAARLEFRAKPIAKSDTVSLAEHPWLSSFRRRSGSKIPRRFGTVVAFFDSAPASGQTSDEALVQKLSDEYEPLVPTWGRIFIFLRGCFQSTHQMIWEKLLTVANGDFEKFLGLMRNVETLQAVVAEGRSLSVQQQQLAAELEAKFPEQQKTSTEFAELEKRGCGG